MSYDLVIRNGTVVDGSGAPRFRSDVGVSDGTITTIGRIPERGSNEVDAEGHFVAPGFVDGHTHLDAQVFWDPMGTSASWHGVTSVVMGNCGFTLAPCREEEADLVFRSLERAEDMDRTTLIQGVKWEWESFPEFLDAVERLPKGVNYSAYVGHSALRAYVMGERAFTDTAGEDDLRRMVALVEESLDAGAVGFSTTRMQGHRTRDGAPVASRLATWQEVCRLVDAMARKRAGVFEISNEVHPDPEVNAKNLQNLADLALASGRPFTFPISFPASDPQRGVRRLRMMETVAAAGGHMVGQVSSRELLAVMGFKVNLPFDQLPQWKRFRAQPLAAQRAGLLDADQRERLVREASEGPYQATLTVEAPPPNYEIMRIYDVADGGACRTVAEVARERGVNPVDVVIDHSLDTHFDGLFVQVLGNDDPDSVLAGLAHPHTVLAISDTGAHVTQVIDSSNPTFVLSNWVRRMQRFTWEEGVKLLSADPASVWGLDDRGLVREGYAADLVVFDPETVAPAIPTVDHDFPGGATRLKQTAVGIHTTVVNGEVTLRDGEHTGALPGLLMRHRSPAS